VIAPAVPATLAWRTFAPSRRVLGAAITGGILGVPVLLLLPGARDALLVLALAAGAVLDLHTRRVPNWLTAGAGAFALASTGNEVTTLLGGCAALACGVALVIAARGAYGMGDVKAMAVAGATVGIGDVMPFLLWMSLAGGVGVALLALRGRGIRGETMAYAPAIAAGCVLALLLPR
jgi:Flp pilus assembly protein protease CpaA